MKQFKIFKHPSGAVEAVKQGWSWPAFFGGVLWAAAKRLWVIGFGVLSAFLVIGFLVANTASDQWGDAIVNGLGATANLIFGVHGNGWREWNLISRGFELKKTVTAANPREAIDLYLKNEAPV